jgi:hypothetical protein
MVSMSESKDEHHHGNERHRGINVHHDQPAYWKRMHHDWRFWVALIFMSAAITIYVASNDLSLPFGGHAQPALPANVAP